MSGLENMSKGSRNIGDYCSSTLEVEHPFIKKGGCVAIYNHQVESYFI